MGFVYDNGPTAEEKVNLDPDPGDTTGYVDAAAINITSSNTVDIRNAFLAGLFYCLVNSSSAVSAANTVRVRANGGLLQVSQNTGAYANFVTSDASTGVVQLGDDPGIRLLIYEGVGSDHVQHGLGIDMTTAVRELTIFHSTSTGSDGRMSFGQRDETTTTYTEKMSLAGDLLTTKLQLIQDIANNSNLLLQFVRGTQASGGTPTTYGSPYFTLGGEEYNTNGLQNIGFGYTTPGDKAPAEFGFLTTLTTGNTKGAFVWALRDTTGSSDVPVERMRLMPAGRLLIGTTTDDATNLLQVNGQASFTKHVDPNTTDQSGSPGAATQNSATGLSAIAASASSVVITNSLCLAGSRVQAWVQQASADATLLQVVRTSVAAGAFTIYGNAVATSAVVVAWEVTG